MICRLLAALDCARLGSCACHVEAGHSNGARPRYHCPSTMNWITSVPTNRELTGHSGIDLTTSVNELPCFRKLRIELTEKRTFRQFGFTFPDSRFSSTWITSG
jgi:hypothetical protein